jgi:hypothetical protein
LRWVEPAFARVRNFDERAWIIRTAAVGFFLFSTTEMDPTNPLRAFAVAFGIVLFYEATMFARTISIGKYGIRCGGIFETLGIWPLSMIGTVHWNRFEIQSVQMLQPKQKPNNLPCHAMLVRFKHAHPMPVGIPTEISLAEVAARIRELGITVDEALPADEVKSNTSNST